MTCIMFKEEFALRRRRCELFVQRLHHDRFRATIPLEVTCARVGTRDLRPEVALDEDFRPLREGERWGGPWENAWLRASVELPPGWEGEDLAFELDMSGECLIFDAQLCPWYAVTGCSVFNVTYRKDLFFPQEWMKRGSRLEFVAECTGSSLFGVNLRTDPHRTDDGIGGDFDATARRMRLGILNREAWQLYYDYEVLYQLCMCSPEGSYRRRQLLTVLNAAADAYGDDPEGAAAARRVLAPELARPAVSSALQVHTVGHAHLDVAWLWTVQDGARKAVRTFASQLEMIRRYPGYIFGASQPQLYEFVRQRSPELFRKVQQAVDEGRWELQGGMWVEADCNIISGESMVRQFLHGQGYYRCYFGRTVDQLWLPDVFGYSAALPQIIRLSGCSYFLTQKLSWSQYNKFPHHSFIWRGIDGSSVLTHFPPEDTYSSEADPIRRTHAQDNYAQADVAPLFASLIGLGDGGGGPAEGHLERELRVRNLEGCPRSQFSSARDFFRALEHYRDHLPVWDGELYLEMHRGTLTNQARTKRNNRRLEQALVQLEWVASCLPPQRYPREALSKLWRVLLLNQFHDIIPGSSIEQTYRTTEQEHEEALRKCRELTEALASELCRRQENAVALINTLPSAWVGLVRLPEACRDRRWTDEEGKAVPLLEDESGNCLALAQIPPQGTLTLRVREDAGASADPSQAEASAQATEGAGDATAPSEVAASELASLQAEFPGLLWMSNELVAYGFAPETMKLMCVRDFEDGRTLRFPHGGNDLLLYVDRPNNYEGWDIDQWYRSEGQPQRPHRVQVGRLCQSAAGCLLHVRYEIGRSEIRQTLVLPRSAKRLDFETEVDWHEQRRVLRVEFPVEMSRPRGFYEIQYGYVERALHSNTSWEMAQFEVPCQRYIDLSDPDGGIALLNDCKYGSKLRRDALELTLLRSALYPDYRHEEGRHRFTYSLLPHEGSPAENSLVGDAADGLNRGPLVLPGREALLRHPAGYRLLPGSSVKLEVIKRAEDSDERVLRLVETCGRTSDCVLIIPTNAPDLVSANLLEEANPELPEARVIELEPRPSDIGEGVPADCCKVLRLRPFQILTLIEQRR